MKKQRKLFEKKICKCFQYKKLSYLENTVMLKKLMFESKIISIEILLDKLSNTRKENWFYWCII